MFNTTRMYYGWTQVSTDITECSGGSREEAWRARPSPCFQNKLRPDWPKKILGDRPAHPPSPLPLYRKVWIRQCSVKLYTSCLPFLVEYCLYNKLRNVRISLPEDLFLAYVFLVLFFCSFLILIVLFLLSSLLFSHKAISSRWLINTRKKLIVGPEDCRILLLLFFAAKKSFDRQDKQEIVLNCTTCTFLSLLFGKKFRTRVPGFSNCSMNSLKRLNDWCLYNVPTYKV